MAREFYTEKDIEDLVRRGVMSLQLGDDVVLTELAYEKASRLGLKLLSGSTTDSTPAAPMRPYLSQGPLYQKPAAASSVPATRQPSPAPTTTTAAGADARPVVPAPAPANHNDLHQRIHNAVIAKLGSQVDAGLLDAIITRVLNSTGVK